MIATYIRNLTVHITLDVYVVKIKNIGFKMKFLK